MAENEIKIPEMGELHRPKSRRAFFKSVAVAGAGVAAGTALLGGTAGAQSSSGNTDVDIANFALTLEYLEADFYAKAVNSGVLTSTSLPTVQNLASHEQQHVEAITKLLQSVGATPVAKPQITYPSDAFSSEASILKLAATFEPVGVGAYLGAAPMIQSPDVLAAAGSIAGVEGEHVVAINALIGVVPFANTAFPAALSKDQVLAAVAPFLGMGSMMDTGGPALKG